MDLSNYGIKAPLTGISPNEWCEIDLWTSRYVAPDGMILGEVRKMGSGNYHATHGNRNLGRYIDQSCAKRAVVNANIGIHPAGT